MVNKEPTNVATVFYGGISVLEQTLPTWLQSFGPLEVNFTFVDNTEGDEVRELLVELGYFKIQKMTYQKSNSNLGFAAGANKAIASSSSSRILLLNPDTFVDKFLAEQIFSEQLTANEPFVAFGLKTSGAVHTGISINKIGFFVDSSKDMDQIIGPSGGAMLFDRDVFINLGGFAEQLFAWGEDAEFSLRLYSQNINTRKSQIVIPHVGGHTIASEAGAKLKAKLINRNRILIVRAAYSVPAQFVWLPIILMAILANMAIRAERRKTIFQALSGVRNGFKEPLTFAWNAKHRLSLSQVNRLCWGRQDAK
jgi:N-acetylglucosaminyl-diphospho-decaprenol L-rhamnosyltransferase